MKENFNNCEVELSTDSLTSLSPEQESLFNIMENTDNNLLIIGGAGVGKSFSISYFRKHSKKKILVLAPTGVAALNVKGQTIHSVFRLEPTVQDVDDFNYLFKIPKPIKKLIREVDTIILDEVSMIRPDLIDMIDQKCRIIMNNSLPFGGIQIIFVGDLFQLSPIVKNRAEYDFLMDKYHGTHFFNAPLVQESDIKVYELTEIFRQKNSEFKDLLNKVRVGSVSQDILEKINCRVGLPNNEKAYITLTGKNVTAERINNSKLNELEYEEHIYYAEVNGDIRENSFPCDVELHLKVGAQIMMVANDDKRRWVNGTLGTITKLNKGAIFVEIDGEEYEVKEHVWKNYKYEYDNKTGKIEQVVVGDFKQFPIKLGWAITIHKSQGKTFNSVFIDLEDGAFATGQVYVALSRCTSLEHLYLKNKISMRDIQVDNAALWFMRNVKISNLIEDGKEVDYTYNVDRESE